MSYRTFLSTLTAPVIDGRLRGEVLRWASQFTLGADQPRYVLYNAQPLLDWLGEATTQDDLDNRARALRQQHSNCCGLDDDRYRDNPHAFLDAARLLHAFIAPDSTTESTVPTFAAAAAED